MQRYNGQLINQFPNAVFGNAAAGVSVTVKVKSTGELATLYSDNSTSSATLTNPLTTDSVGAYSFYAADGVYTLDFSFSGLPQQVVQLQDVAELQSRFDDAVLNAGYIPSGTFTAGATLTQANQVLSDGSSYWRWDGSFPKVVSAGSSPTPTGAGSWILISDAGFRDDLADINSEDLIANEEAWKMATKLRSVNCLMFIAPENRAAAISGAYDVGAAVQAAVNAAVSLDLPYLEGAGDYWIGTTNIVSPSTRDLTWKGAGRDLTNYFTDLNNGSKAIAITGQWYDIGEFRITSKSGTKKNFIGLSVGDTVANTSTTRSRVRVKASYAAVGVEARGWVTDLDIFTTYCDLGFKGEELNSCSVKLRGEHNVQGFAIDGAIATTFEQLLEENTFTTGATTVPSYIDNFKSIAISSLYLEGGVFSTTAVNFAPVTQSYGLTIDSVSSEIVPADKTQPIVIDKVHGVAIAGNVYAGGFNATVGFTANARGISPLLTAPPATSSGSNSTMRLQDLSKQIRKADNFSGDPYFTHLVNSFDAVTKTGTTLSADTTNIINGKRSLRIDATTGASLPQVELRRTVNRLPRVANLVGKTVKALAWVFVPNLTKFADRTYQFGIEIAFGGGASLTSTMQRTTLAGTWNLVETPAITAPAGWTGASADRFNIRFYVVGNTSAAVDAGYYVVVDSWFLCDGNTSIIDIQRGNFEDYNLLGVSTDGDKLRLVSDNFEGATNADSTFAVGDIIEHAAPAPSGFIGKVCTTAGAVGSTAVFKTYGAISA